jgi:DNA-binding MarR family transcriptional regulator
MGKLSTGWDLINILELNTAGRFHKKTQEISQFQGDLLDKIVSSQLTLVSHQLTMESPMTASNKALKGQGYSPDDIALARLIQQKQREAGAPPRSLLEILQGQPARPRPQASPADLTANQLKRRGAYGQAALLADQAALSERDPHKAEQARQAATILKGLGKTNHLEYNILAGNFSMSHEFLDTLNLRLKESGATIAARNAAVAALVFIARNLEFQGFACTKNAAELSELLGVKPQTMKDTLKLLEKVGAITRIKRGRQKVITINPEGAFRGSLDPANPTHAKAVAEYKAKVLPFRDPRQLDIEDFTKA